LLEHVGSRPVRHQGRKMRLKRIQLWCRPTLQRPPDACLDPAARGTMKSGKPHRDLAEKRGDRTLPVVLHMANTATPSTIRPPNGVASGLRDDDLLLEACQHSLRLVEGQTQIGDIGEIIGPVDLHDVDPNPRRELNGGHVGFFQIYSLRGQGLCSRLPSIAGDTQ
jgi:hypothetical protein